ncbi:hypothetical protein H0H87_005265 [Tephrocybe sp. NHM501043]|nr:hypothetical protein H0H87_005265 [Tephrocybe sp. NHM501043]
MTSPAHKVLEPLEEIAAVHDFFHSKLPKLVPGPNHTTSTSTRPPSRLDKHLDPHLALKRVVYCPSIIDDFADIADHSLSQYVSQKSTLPPTELEHASDTSDAIEDPSYLERFPGNLIRTDELSAMHLELQSIINEESVRTIYASILARQCLTVASTLAFQLPIWSSGYLRWEKETATKDNFGIADGFLRVVDTPVKRRNACQLPPPSDTFRKIVKEYPILAVWEFKNLLAGRKAIFEGIRELARDDIFPWTLCEYGDLCGITRAPGHPAASSEEPFVYWKKRGPDAPIPVCKSISEPLSAHQIPAMSEDGLASANITHSIHITQQVWAQMVKNDTTFACLSSGHLKMYFYRRRQDSVLFISDVISTDMKGTAKILTGFLIATLRDAEARVNELEHSPHATWSETNPYKVANTTVTNPEVRKYKVAQTLFLMPTLRS